MAFTPRQGRYITQRRGRYYYRRIVPESYREWLGKKVIMIPLKGGNDSERHKEAQGLAAQHDRLFTTPLFHSPDELPVPDDTVAVYFEIHDDPNEEAPASPRMFFRDGRFVPTKRYAIGAEPSAVRDAAKKGYFAMSEREYDLQLELAELRRQLDTAQTDDQRTIAELRSGPVIDQIQASAASAASHSILSILPQWHEHQKQALTTWKKHVQYAREFAQLHGDLPLPEVTKSHVVDYVAHAQTLRYRGEPLSPTSIAKRLDSIKALLSFAVSADEITYNPATGVKPPKDTRPRTSRSWKSFDREEVQEIVRVSNAIWSKRRNSKQALRKEDLATALQCLIWTGARPEEICQARRDWIDLDRGVFLITNDETDDNARPALVKNESSIRAVPIHSRLKPFIASHLKRHNSALLFPSFEPQPTPFEIEDARQSGRPPEIKGRYARPLSREWTDHLRYHVAPNEPRKVLYSLRHSWAAESRRTGMPEHVRNALMGHADDNPHAARYGGDAEWLEQKRKYVEKMNCV